MNFEKQTPNDLSVTSSIPPFRVKIVDHGEIHMASPYHTCEIELVGFDKIQLPRYGWQDKYAWSADNSNLVLVKWDFTDNEPGFRFFVIDTAAGSIRESERIFGLINDMAIEGNKIKYNKFLLDRQKSRPGNLCCNTDEEYAF
jgi:hypothetical protein